MKRKNKKAWLWEFSKKLIFALTILFIVERIVGAIFIFLNSGAGADTYIQTGADVFTASVVSYAIKAGFENVIKIKKDTSTEVIDDDELN